MTSNENATTAPVATGESHGPRLHGILEGVSAGPATAPSDFERDLSMRQRGYGRSARMKIVQDRVEILRGVHHGKTTRGPSGCQSADIMTESGHGVLQLRRIRSTGFLDFVR